MLMNPRASSGLMSFQVVQVMDSAPSNQILICVLMERLDLPSLGRRDVWNERFEIYSTPCFRFDEEREILHLHLNENAVDDNKELTTEWVTHLLRYMTVW